MRNEILVSDVKIVNTYNIFNTNVELGPPPQHMTFQYQLEYTSMPLHSPIKILLYIIRNEDLVSGVHIMDNIKYI